MLRPSPYYCVCVRACGFPPEVLSVGSHKCTPGLFPLMGNANGTLVRVCVLRFTPFVQRFRRLMVVVMCVTKAATINSNLAAISHNVLILFQYNTAKIYGKMRVVLYPACLVQFNRLSSLELCPSSSEVRFSRVAPQIRDTRGQRIRSTRRPVASRTFITINRQPNPKGCRLTMRDFLPNRRVFTQKYKCTTVQSFGVLLSLSLHLEQSHPIMLKGFRCSHDGAVELCIQVCVCVFC